MWRINNMLLNNKWLNEETGYQKNTWRHMKMETQQSKIYRTQEKQF